MSAVPHLATIDLLCAREFPAMPGRSDLGSGGPGYHIAELRPDGGLQDSVESETGAVRESAEDQCEAERDGLGTQLVERWGPPQIFALQGAVLRAAEYDVDLAEPWASLSARVGDVHLWHTGTRWIALAVARLDPSRPPTLLAVATDVDPP